MEEQPDKKKSKDQEFIVETPIVIEEKINNSDKIVKYERGKFLGKGGFAKCYEMKRVDTGKIYAAKLFEKKALVNQKSRNKLINEIKLHKKLHHQNIVNFEHFFEDKENVYILLELCSNQTLNELVKRRKRLTEIEVQCYLLQIIKALKYIHSHKIIHRDLKLGNLFITQKLELKLGDFGLAAKLDYEGQRRRTLCGTPNYIAPEILEQKNGHSYEVDIWSLGVVMYTMLFGRPPFETVDVNLTYKRIKMKNYSFPENIKVDPTAKKLISSILNLDPSKRPSLDAIAEHDFFKMYHSVPVLMPLSTLACPPSQVYISKYTKNEGKYINNFNNKKKGEGDNIGVNNNNNNNNDTTSRNKNELGGNVNYNSDDNNNNYDADFDETMLKKLGDGATTKFIQGNTNNNFGQGIPPVINFFSKKISKYFDYSSKFGVVYFINNTHIGVCFNDYSNILRHINKDQNDQDLANTNNYDYIYLERDAQSTQNFDEIGLENYLGSKNTSQEIIKKFGIFKHIVNKHSADFEKVKKEKFGNNNNEGGISRLFFVKKYLVLKNAILFRLSNKLIQIVFNDSTEIVFSTETNDFVYKNKKGEEEQDSIQNAMNGDNQDVIKKIKIAKNMLIYFVKNHKSKKVPK
jgi:polo-like kinase 1